MKLIEMNLGDLRLYDTWMDEGMAGEDDRLTDDVTMTVYEDGSVNWGDGVFIEAGEGGEHWMEYVHSLMQ